MALIPTIAVGIASYTHSIYSRNPLCVDRVFEVSLSIARAKNRKHRVWPLKQKKYSTHIEKLIKHRDKLLGRVASLHGVRKCKYDITFCESLVQSRTVCTLTLEHNDSFANNNFVAVCEKSK